MSNKRWTRERTLDNKSQKAQNNSSVKKFEKKNQNPDKIQSNKTVNKSPLLWR